MSSDTDTSDGASPSAEGSPPRQDEAGAVDKTKLTVDVTEEGLGDSGTPGSMSTGRALNQDSKIFVGGLSWETTDAKLKNYFENFATVEDAYVSYDRKSGRPRGFGFVCFEDPAVVDKVVAMQHTIDRREVEAKRALPKEESPVSKDMQAAASGQRTKKIFVGGLAGSVDEGAFREYFEKYGAVDDAVVMYDQHNHRPRGFGFITFTDEKSVDDVFADGFIQRIHNKEIEIKRAIPRESGVYPSPKALYRSPQDRYGHRTPGSVHSRGRGGFRRDQAYMMPGMHPIRGIEHGPMDMPHGIVTGIPAYMSPPPMAQVGGIHQAHGHPVPHGPPHGHPQHGGVGGMGGMGGMGGVGHPHPGAGHPQQGAPQQGHPQQQSPPQGIASPYGLGGASQHQQTSPGPQPAFPSQLQDVNDISLESVSQALEQLSHTPPSAQNPQQSPGSRPARWT